MTIRVSVVFAAGAFFSCTLQEPIVSALSKPNKIARISNPPPILSSPREDIP
jgi:hypothetical protein